MYGIRHQFMMEHFRKGVLIGLLLLITLPGCKVLQRPQENSYFGDWEMHVLVSSGLKLEVFDSAIINIVQANEVNEPLNYRLIVRAKSDFYMNALKSRLLSDGVVLVSLVKK